MSSKESTKNQDFTYKMLALVLGDPATRTARLLILAGVGLISFPWWVPFLEIIIVAVFDLSPEDVNLDQNSLAAYHGWALILLGITWIVLQRQATDSMPVGFFGKFLVALVAQKMRVVIPAMFGAFGMLNLLDSILPVVLDGYSWPILNLLDPLFLIFRKAIHFLFELILIPLNVSIPAIIQDFLAMSIIVAGMRFRSSMVIQNAIKNGGLIEYREKIMGRDLTVNEKSSKQRWFAFFFWRIGAAFIAWPQKLGGATIRYLLGDLRSRGTGPMATKVQLDQYLTFFGTVAWALFIAFDLLVIYVATL